MLGETDFPCISGERLGVGRTYVGLVQPPKGDAGYGAWTEGIRNGRLYFGDGRSHFIDYRIGDQNVGIGEVELSQPGTVRASAHIAARLEEGSPTSAGSGLASPAGADPRYTQCDGRSCGERSSRRASVCNCRR